MAKGIVIAGTHSGCGKTTITLGVLAALKKKGLKIQPFKAGPDFIDTGLHRIITGRSSRNLDIWMCGEDYVKDCFYRHSLNADMAIVEGVMGMYDGEFSTAILANILNLPVILVVDAYGMGESAGAVVKGFIEFENPKSLIAGVIFNRVASENHYIRLKNSIHNIEVLGYLPRDLNFEIPHRHLGLIVAEETPIAKENIEKLADAVLEHIDADKVMRQWAARGNKQELETKETTIASRPSPIASVAIAYDRAFCFYYEDNLDLLRDTGAEVVTFSPISDSKIPDCANAVYIGGGYPELYAEELSKNISMLESINNWTDSGKPIYAECGGLMYLSQGIHDFNGNFFKMAGVFPFETIMKKRRSHLGYREIILKEDCIVGKRGDKLRGHEFHYSEIKESFNMVQSSVYKVKDGSGQDIQDKGYRFKNTLASYIHIHFGSNPDIARNFINFIKEQ